MLKILGRVEYAKKLTLLSKNTVFPAQQSKLFGVLDAPLGYYNFWLFVDILSL